MIDKDRRCLTFVCGGCGAQIGGPGLAPFSCPAAREGDGVDHVLARELDTACTTFEDDGDENPFVAFRALFAAHELASAHGITDAEFVALTNTLDTHVAKVDGEGFRRTPLFRSEALERELGFAGPLFTGALWVKDETENVSGSHKARHLMGIMLYLQVAERVGLMDPNARAPLAIASCGNAALAAAVVARAAGWPLSVFVPPEAPRSTLERLDALGATLHVSRRSGERPPGDPCYLDFKAALAQGALPFCCQGPDNGLTLEGGQTLGYELVSQLMAKEVVPHRLFIQVGGGALASATIRAMAEAHAWGLLARMPRVHAVQTKGAFPLTRAYKGVVARLLRRQSTPQKSVDTRALWIRDELSHDTIDAALHHAAAHRAQYMEPWPGTPQSIASGILDDETYDWLKIIEGMLKSGGYPLVVDEETLIKAHTAAQKATEIHVCPTGTAGLAGLMALGRDGVLAGDTSVVLFTGHLR
ncbi:MAG: pyridoxal-phosphate dependent enzyme [Deltaproteobacteria bacterium]|nr:pyridoxal-phosphate dependent enzyme [Deltaproteobacteria bacterium]